MSELGIFFCFYFTAVLVQTLWCTGLVISQPLSGRKTGYIFSQDLNIMSWHIHTNSPRKHRGKPWAISRKRSKAFVVGWCQSATGKRQCKLGKCILVVGVMIVTFPLLLVNQGWASLNNRIERLNQKYMLGRISNKVISLASDFVETFDISPSICASNESLSALTHKALFICSLSHFILRYLSPSLCCFLFKADC